MAFFSSSGMPSPAPLSCPSFAAAIAQPATQRSLSLTGHTIRRLVRGASQPAAAGALYASDFAFVFDAETRR